MASEPPGRPATPLTRGIIVALLSVITFGVAIRLYLVDEPLSGVRMTDTAALARNFHEESMNLFYPRVDWRGSTPGFVESEFPIYSYVIAALYRVLGVHDWIGRLFNIVVYALSALFLFRMTCRLFDPLAGILAAAFYTVAPLSYMYTLTFQPDALMALASLAAVYWFWLWTETDRRYLLVLSGAALFVAVGIKPMSLYLGLPLLYLAGRRFGWGVLRQPALWIYAAAVLLPSAAWFHHSWSLWDQYGNTFGILGGWNKIGTPTTIGPWFKLTVRLAERLWSWIATPGGLLLLTAGLIRRAPGRNYLLHWWTVGFGVSIAITLQGHLSHGYYQLPIVFPVAAWMGLGASRIWENPWRLPRLTRVILAILVLSVPAFALEQYRDGPLGRSVRVSERDRRRIAFAEEVASLTEPDAPVIFVIPYRGRPALYQHRTPYGEYLECDPVDFYRSHRRGWSLDERQATPDFVATLRDRGARYLATAFPEILENHPELDRALRRDYELVREEPGGVLFRLGGPPAAGEAGFSPTATK